MAEAMKIWKSDLQGLLEEVQGPVYVFSASETRADKSGMMWGTFYVAAAGFNAEGHICELRLIQQSIPAMIPEERNEAFQKNRKAFEEIRARLEGLGREVRDGCISNTPIGGTL